MPGVGRVSPMEAWARVQQDSRRLTEHEARQVWSGFWVSDLVTFTNLLGERLAWRDWPGVLLGILRLRPRP